jgi:hypothetical protein
VIAGWSVSFAQQASGAWTRDTARTMLTNPLPWSADARMVDPPEGTYRVAGGIINFWNSIPITFIAATLVASAASASAMLYLAMRQVCDGQDLGELWTEGEVEGAMAESMESRGDLTKQALGDSTGAPPVEYTD